MPIFGSVQHGPDMASPDAGCKRLRSPGAQERLQFANRWGRFVGTVLRVETLLGLHDTGWLAIRFEKTTTNIRSILVQSRPRYGSSMEPSLS
jgi:hypothetical protein